MATIVDGKNRIPFRRGMLISYLIQRGFAYEEAETLANQVREALGKKETQRKEIVRLVRQLIEKENGDDLEVGDLVFWERLPTSIFIEGKEGTRPFSKEVLSHSIQASGLPGDTAFETARAIESRLIDQRQTCVTHTQLQTLTAQVLAEHHDKSYAERYRVWRAWGDLDKPLFILIGGASGVGKTSLAVSLASLLDIPRVVATDDIRQIMRLTLAPELMPFIHTSSYTAWKMAQTDGATDLDPVIAAFREQAKVVSVGVGAILTRCIEEGTSVIIDGVHLLPDYIDFKAYRKVAFIVPMCLALEDQGRYGERFAKREATAPSRPSYRYIHHLDEIMKIQEYLVEQSAQYEIPVVDADTIAEATSQAAMLVVEHLQEQEEVQAVAGRKSGKKKKRKN